MAMHATFVSEHNRIAATIYDLIALRNPLWSPEKIDDVTFEETRRIIGAIHQV